MKLIIGGYAQGKKEYVRDKYNLSDDYIFESTLPSEDEIQKLSGNVLAINNFHLWLKPRIENEENPEEEIEKFVKKNPNCIIICDEIGNGIVPMDAFEREYRERLGRALISLASQADEVERVICGMAQKIK
jgi:adenosyl cobinamide kinase/adenosyl cobinamide phosphate guanylyltransferase